MANSNSLKEVLCENLLHILSPDKNVRELAEQQLAMLETNEDYGLQLMEISLTENIDFSVRHLASVILDRYITKHWTDLSEKFEAPEVSATVKPLIREYLLKSLVITATANDGPELDHATKKLLSSFAHSLSKIAAYDWPANWPGLFPVLSEYLASGSPSALYSTLKVFKELSHEIIDTQIPNVAPVLLPQMLNIFVSAGQFSPRARSNAIKIFVTISETIMMMDDYQKNSIKTYLAPHIPRYAEAVISVLMTPDNSPEVDIGLKKEIINGLTKFLKSCRKYFKAYLPKIMELIWHGLTTSANVYVQRMVNSNSFDDLESGGDFYSEATDSDGETIGFESYIYAIIDFVNTIFESTKYRELIKPVLADLLYYIMFYIQITDEQVESWQSNLDKFIEDDDIDSTGYSVRIAAQDLILNLSRDMTTIPECGSVKKDDELFKIAFLQAIKRHFAQASEMEKVSPNKSWWKLVESCLFSLGMIAPTIIYTINSGTPLANEYKGILDTVLSNTTHLNQPFLAGRSIWTASRFSPIMNDQSLDNFLKLTASVLSMADQPILRIYALRSTYYFCDNVSVNQKVHVIKPYLTQFLQGLVSIGMHANSDILDLVLQTIAILLRLDSEFTVSVAGSICSLATSAFLQYPDDPTIFDVALELYDELFKLEQCRGQVADRILPTIVSILNAPPGSASAQIAFKDGSNQDGFRAISNILTLQPQALDILTNMVRHSPTPLPDVLIQQVYPALMRCLAGASKEDTAILQNGSECIRHYVAKGSDQLVGYVDPATNQNGIVLALNICNNLLNPQIPESCSTFIGRLIITLILKANPLIGHDNIQHLLRSTLVKLNTTKELILTQSLILVFAHLLYTDLATILIFLNSLPAPDGTKSALEFVLDRWLSIQLYFTGYENKASTVALCRLFQHSLSDPNSPQSGASGDLALINLHRIEVSCDDMNTNAGSGLVEVPSSGAIRTRSKANQENASRKVPSTVKILKLLLNEYNHLQELKEAAGAKFSDEDDDDDDSEDDDSGVHDAPSGTAGSKLAELLKKQDVIDLTDLLLEDGEELEEDEEEILSEEIAAIDLEDALRSVLRAFKTVPIASEFFVHLTTSERELLNGL